MIAAEAHTLQHSHCYGENPLLIGQAPGRLEVLGNHTDYNQGQVLSLATDRTTMVSISPSEDHFHLASAIDQYTEHTFSQKQMLSSSATGHWTDYVKGVVQAMQAKGQQVPPFKACISSDVPLSAGMSSSASLEMALTKSLACFINQQWDPREMAEIGQTCENQFIGANTGLMDQLTSLCGEQGKLVWSEYQHVTFGTLPFPSNYGFVVIDSHIKHDLTEEYNQRRLACEKASELFVQHFPKVSSLGGASLRQLQTLSELLTTEVRKRARHVIEECQRVQQAKKYLAHLDMKAFGQLLFASHQSSVDNFENSCRELDTIIQAAQQHPLCLGARLSGGGFGGVSIHLVEWENRHQYQTDMEKSLTTALGFKPDFWQLRPSGGATIIKGIKT